MKSFCKCLIISGAVAGMMIGAASSYITAVMLKNKTSMCDVMKCRAKEAFKSVGHKFSL